MSVINDYCYWEPGELGAFIPTQVELEAITTAILQRREGSANELPREGLVVTVDHGRHSYREDGNSVSLVTGAFVVGTWRGRVLATEFVRDRERWDPNARSPLNLGGGYVEDGPDPEAIEKVAQEIGVGLRELAASALRASARHLAEELAHALAEAELYYSFSLIRLSESYEFIPREAGPARVALETLKKLGG